MNRLKKNLTRRLLAAVLTAAVLAGSMAVPVSAADTTTYPGSEETIKVASSQSLQRETDFNADWKFSLGTPSTAQNKDFNDSSWKSVSLPHDFSISQSFTTSGEAESGFLPGGTGWYRKHFTLPESCAGQTLVLGFDGVYAEADVYVNGTHLGEHHYGYTSFAFDISDYVTCDGLTDNVIAVKAVNNIPSSRWYSGSGIYRDVTLIATDPVHVARYGTHVTTPDIASNKGTVNVTVDVDNDSSAAVSATVRNTVYTQSGTTASSSVESALTIPAGSSATASASPVVSNPKLWSLDDPNLYFIHTEVLVDGQVTDTYDTTFGFRYFSFDDTGFHLNGQNVKLNGVCLHHDQGALGSAAYYDAMYRQLSIMKDMGVNAIRTSHNPADEDFIDICNELGLLVIEEAFDGLNVAKNGNSYDFSQYFTSSVDTRLLGASSSMTCAEYAARSMVRRDRNDPAIIAWSFGNEIQEGASTSPSFPDIAEDFITWVQAEDPSSRPITIGDNTRGGNTTLTSVINKIVASGGVAGFNYANTASQLYSLAQDFGNVIIATETSSATNSRGQYQNQNNNANSDGNYHLTSYDTSAVGWGITAHDSLYNTYQYDCVAGEFVWTGFDYIGEPTPWNGTGTGSASGSGAIPNSSYFGIVDTAGFEKDTYYLYRSQWNQKDTTLHLVTAWDSDNMMTTNDGKTPVVVYSNAPVVKLYRNGTLIGTATRTAHTSSAGHTYYTYTTASNDATVCTAVNASGSASLYATFNVVYEAGSITAEAYTESGTKITNTSGSSAVYTPGTPAKLAVTQNKTAVAADGSSLTYIEVEVQDASGHLDTTATNTINFSLEGNGEIVGVDNGDQATTAKYQQSSVLTSTTSAKIAAYAGKALVIVRSTRDAGRFTVNVSSPGLTGGSASVTTTAVDSGETQEGLASYTMVRDYSVMAGTTPSFQTTATGTLSDGATVTGTISWNTVSSSTYSTPGDYTINGTLTFPSYDDIPVTCRLHVIADVIAMRNISTVTMTNTVPTLPSTVRGVLADGTLSGEFSVQWNAMSASQFATVGNIVVVSGTATVIGSTTLPVTASIRVAEAVNTESTNVAGTASSLTEDCASTSDNLSSIIDGVTSNSSDTNARWTNYNNRNTSSTASITFQWATAQLISSANLYFFTDSYSASLPASVKFEYSLNGSDFTEIGYTDVTPTAGFTETAYVFDQVINPVALRITLTEQSGKCVGLTEVQIMTYAGRLTYNSSADLSGITVDGTAVSGFSAGTLSYTAAGSESSAVTAATGVNAGITVLPIYRGVVRILTVSEDGSSAKTYAVMLEESSGCAHEHTELRNAKAATCSAAGYTGDTVCIDCGATLSFGSTIAKLAHTTELRNYQAATCTATGYTGDTVCTVCDETVKTGSVIPTTDHKFVENSRTETEIIYICTACSATKTVAISQGDLGVTVSADRISDNRIALTGCFEDYESASNVTGHGLIYLRTDRLGSRTLTVNTAGRTRVSFSGYKSDGSFRYTMYVANSSTEYTVRAFLAYTNDDGRTAYVYSDPITVSANDL